ncbi:MAG TPA: hypothetical protein PLR18_04020 [bacterium]|nr:hypothetical protein [bacterium]
MTIENKPTIEPLNPASERIKAEFRGQQPPKETNPTVDVGTEVIKSNPPAMEVYNTLRPESKGLWSGLCEKVRAGLQKTDIGQWAVDKFDVWNSNRLEEKADKKVASYEEEVKRMEQKLKGKEMEIEETKSGRIKVEALMTELGSKISPEDQKKHDMLMGSLEEQKKQTETDVDIKKKALEIKKDKANEYAQSVEAVKKGIDGRLAEKMSINDKAIEGASKLVDTNKANRNVLSGELEKNSSAITRVEGYINQEKPKGLDLEVLRKELAKLEKARKDLSGQIRELEIIGDRLTAEVEKLQGKNASLKVQRDKLFPPPEAVQKGEIAKSNQPGEESELSKGIDEGDIVVGRPDGGSMTLIGDKLIIVGADGKEVIKSGEQITDDELGEIVRSGGLDKLEAEETVMSIKLYNRMKLIEQNQKSESAGGEYARESGKESEAKKMTLEKLIALWNSYHIKKLGREKVDQDNLLLDREDSEDPKLELATEDLKLVLQKKLAKKGEVNKFSKLNGSVRGRAGTFLRELAEGELQTE